MKIDTYQQLCEFSFLLEDVWNSWSNLHDLDRTEYRQFSTFVETLVPIREQLKSIYTEMNRMMRDAETRIS